MSFLSIESRRILVAGIANRKSVAFHIARRLQTEGAELIFSVQSQEQKDFVEKSFPGNWAQICDVSDESSIKGLCGEIVAQGAPLHGIVHSIAFANFSSGIRPFHDTVKADFLQAFDISCYSFIAMAGLLKPILADDASLLTISISSTRMAAESYGYMAPIKAALDSSVVFLAKSLGSNTSIRVNAIGASLLKTSSSAGIPGYIEPYIFAEKATIRKRALETEEVANVAAFLLSPASSGINAQTIVVDAGMGTNYFDREIVSAAVKNA